MIVDSKNTGRALSMPAGLALGGVSSLTMTILLSAVLSKLVDAETLSEENIGYGVMVLLLVASFAGSLISSARIKHQRMLVCLLSGIIYFGILLSITALFFGGQYEAVGVTAILVLGGSITAAFVGLRENRGGKRRKIKAAHR